MSTVRLAIHNGLALMGVSYFWQWVAKGSLIVVAVAIHRLRRREE